jgi:hypothetical protein
MKAAVRRRRRASARPAARPGFTSRPCRSCGGLRSAVVGFFVDQSVIGRGLRTPARGRVSVARLRASQAREIGKRGGDRGVVDAELVYEGDTKSKET